MAESLHLSSRHREEIEALLHKHLPGVEVWAYGNRVNGRSHDGSDLDLVLRGPRLAKIDASQLADLRDAFEESNLPFRVDVVDWANKSESFREVIERDYVVLVADGEPFDGRSSGVVDGWQTKTFADAPVEIIDGDRGKNYPRQDEFFKHEHCMFLNAGNVTSNGFNFSSSVFITSEKDQRLRKGKLSRGDVVLTTRGTVGNSAYFNQSVPYDHIRINSGMVILRAEDHTLNPLYLYFFIRSKLVLSQIAALRTGSAQPQLPIRDINRVKIAIPPLTEQRAIAHILGTLDDKIELNRRMNETLEAMARALFKSWFVDFDPVRAKMAGRDPGLPKHLADLFPDRLVESELGEIPEGWEVQSIGDVAEVVGGTTPSTKRAEYWKGGTHCWATPKDLSALTMPVLLDTKRKITDAGLQRIGSGLLPPGTVLLSSRAPIGYLAIAEMPVAINQGFIAMLPRERVSNQFLLRWSEAFHDEIVNHANGSTFLEISKSNFRQIPVVTPNESIMSTYGALASSLHKRVASNEHLSRALAALRDALLPRLVSGKLRVKDTERIVEIA